VRAGANANSVTGLFFSLFPSVALGGIAWAAKRHLFREFEEEEQEGDNSEEEVKQSLIQFGQFSIGTKTRGSFCKTLKKVNTNSAAQDEEEKIEVKEDGDAAVNLTMPPTNGSNESHDVGTSQKHISLEMDEHSAL